MRDISRLVGVLLVAAPLAGCGFLDTAGPCLHAFEDPVLRIASASATNGATLDTLRLSGFSVNRQPVQASVLLGEAEYEVELKPDGSVICTVACGFGTAEGTYAFTAAADGYQPRTVTVDARYSEFTGGCPSSSAGSTDVSIELAP